MKRKVENYDKNGNIIPDLSKVVIPKKTSDLIVRLLYEAEEAS